MKMIKLMVASAVLGSFVMANHIHAQDTNTMYVDSKSKLDRLNESPLYRAQELDVDLFGAASVGDQTIEHPSASRFRHRGLYGGGGGLTFFFCRYVGVGGEYDAETRSGVFDDRASGNVYLRLPLFNTGLAPYIFGGGGYQFQDVRQSFGQGGGGLEYRFCRNVGIFADGRYVAPQNTENFVQVRAGLRISF